MNKISRLAYIKQASKQANKQVQRNQDDLVLQVSEFISELTESEIKAYVQDRA